MADWRGVILGDVAELLVGYAFKSTEFSKDLKVSRLLRGINIGQGYLDWSATSYWPEEGSHSRYALHCGDVILAMDRPWIEAGLKRARVRERDLPALLVQRVARIRGTGAASTSYLYHIISSPHFCEYARSSATGTTVPHISESQIARYQFRLPSQQDQDRICHLLDGIDDLIENNRRRIELLEQMAQAIYREWFVRFRYPGHEDVPLVDSTVGTIPDGWEISTCGEQLTVLGGGTPSKMVQDYWDRGTIRWYTPSDLTRRHTRFSPIPAARITEYGLKHSSARLFPTGSVLMTSRATLGVLAIATSQAACNQGFIVIPPDRRWPSGFIYEWLSWHADELAALGTGATFKEITKRTFKNFPFVIPSQRVLDAFRMTIEPIESSVMALEQQSRRLESLRDLLLPRLVTGKIDVSRLDLDVVLEGATA